MDNAGSQYMIIKVDTKTGKVVMPPEDEKGNKATVVSQKEIDEIYLGDNGFKHIGIIMHAHSSPGCVYVNLGGWWVKICA